VRNVANVADLPAFRRLLRLVALRTAQQLNMSDLTRDVALSAPTAARYFGLLEATFLVSRLPAWLSNRAAREIKSPNLLFADSGLAAFLSGVRSLAPEAEEPMRPGARLHHWTLHGRHQVDYVIEDDDGRVTGIEVKSAQRFERKDLRGLLAFADAAGERHAQSWLAYDGDEVVPLGPRLWAVPLGALSE